MGDGEIIYVKEGLVMVDRERCRKTEYFTIPHSNNSRNKANDWLVSSCTDGPDSFHMYVLHNVYMPSCKFA